jgi:hypothetical protein
MRLIVVYCVLIAVGELVVYGLGLIVERTIPAFSMLIFMCLFFGVLWGGWPFAVWITERWFLSPDEVRAGRVARTGA